MKKPYYFLLLFISISSLNFKTTKPYEVFYFDDIINIQSSRVSVVDINSQQHEYIKSKIIVTNNFENPLIIKPTDCCFKNNTGGEFYSKDKDWLVIFPGQKASTVIKALSGGEKINTGSLTFNIKKYSLGDKNIPIEGKQFELENNKEFQLGGFTCTILDIDNNEKIKAVKCKVVYNGLELGMLNPSKITLNDLKGKQSENIKNKNDVESRVYFFQKGDKRTLTLKFLFESKKQNILSWNNSLSEYEIKTFDESNSIKLIVDSVKTSKYNRSDFKIIADAVKEDINVIKENTKDTEPATKQTKQILRIEDNVIFIDDIAIGKFRTDLLTNPKTNIKTTLLSIYSQNGQKISEAKSPANNPKEWILKTTNDNKTFKIMYETPNEKQNVFQFLFDNGYLKK